MVRNPGKFSSCAQRGEPAAGMSPMKAIGLFKGVDEAEGHIRAAFVRIIVDGKLDIRPRSGARYDRFCGHAPVRCVTRSRRPWKYPVSMGAVAAEPAPSSSISRRR